MSSNPWPTFSTTDQPMDILVKLSRFYGSDPSIVLAGGGNTSCKIGDTLYVKASGMSLASIEREGFAEMDRPKLEALAQADLGPDPQQREAQFKDAILAARRRPEKGQRPSVECLLHHLLPGTFVVHSHSTLANTLTCCLQGQELAKELFGEDVLWIPYVDPGFTLAQTLKKLMAQYQQRTGRPAPKAILMANHGLIVAGDDPQGIRANTDEVLGRITQRLGPHWKSEGFGKVTRADQPQAIVNMVAPALRGLMAEGDMLKVVVFDDSETALSLCGGEQGQAAVAGGPMTPDQIVYCNSYPLWFVPAEQETPTTLVERLRQALLKHQADSGYAPKVVLAQGVGLFAIGDDWAGADTTRALYLDAVAVMAGARKHGSISHFTASQRSFIEQWEVEAYRKQIAAKAGAAAGRVKGKIALVTGGAQGFGLEISQALAAQGAYVVLADVNEAGASAAAKELSGKHGRGRAWGVAVNVTSGQSMQACIDQVVRNLGGLDVLISNAGVLRAESIKTQSEKDFDFVTAVNYKGYFVSTQKAAPILALQRLAKADYFSDIIQINSKSGLEGSNKNAAYAGSKFGGLGLTQSFAMELVEDGIKVNSICPGNFLDGPLWSDPDNGLFVQYLRTGKVPGAKTVADVRKAYEAKVPLGRGCRTADVMKAIFYLMEQQYETGQALPVTGGQVMLK